MPTAVLSTHTGDISGFTYRDLTGDMPAIAAHWKSLGIRFDAVYSGFLGSTEQVNIVSDFIDDARSGECVVIVDPAMADSETQCIKTFNPISPPIWLAFAKGRYNNTYITEAAILLRLRIHREPVHSREYIESLLHSLSIIPQRQCSRAYRLTAAPSAAPCSTKAAVIYHMFSQRNCRVFITARAISSLPALTGAYMRGRNIAESADIATRFTFSAIERTYIAGTDPRFGVTLKRLGAYINMLESKHELCRQSFYRHL